MASLYKYSRGGYKIRFHIFYPNGTNRTAYKYTKTKQDGILTLSALEKLEILTRKNQITAEELVYYQHIGALKDDDISKLTNGKQTKVIDWNDLRNEYEIYSEASHGLDMQTNVKSYLKKLEGYFKSIPISSITAQDIIRYQARRLKTAAAQTVKHERNVLNVMLDIAMDLGAIQSNPGRSRLLKGTLTIDKSKLPKALTYDEIETLLTALGLNHDLLSGRICTAALLFLFAGLRRAEVQYLTHDDISNGEVIIQGKRISKDESGDREVLNIGWWTPKTNQARVIPLESKVSAILNDEISKDGGRFVFGGDRVHCKDHYTKTFSKLLKPINPKLTLHCLRHTYITWRIEQGDPLPRVQILAGHSNIETTMRYAHIKVSPEKNILDLIE